MAKNSTQRNLRCSEQIYRLLLLAYPRHFRQAFEREMMLVFRAQCQDAYSAGGLSALARLWLLALVDLIKSAPAEHLAGLERLRVYFAQPQPVLQTNGGAPLPPAAPSSPRRATPRETLLAALPVLVLLLIMVVTHLPLSNQLSLVAGQVLQFGMIALLLVFLVLAWRARFPAWSATWMPFWVLVGYYLPLTWLQSRLQTVDWPGWNILWNSTVSALLVLVAYLFYRLARRDSRQAILASLPLIVIASIFWSEFVLPDIAALVDISAWSLALILTVAGARSLSWKTLLALAGVFALALGIAEAAAQVFALNVPGEMRPDPQLSDLAWRAASQSIPRLMFLLGPILAANIRLLGLACGPRGKRAYRLALGGVLMILVTMLTNSLLTSGPNWQSLLRWRPIGYGLLMIGAGLYLFGWGLMLREGWKNGRRFPALPVALLALSGLLLPFMLATYSGSVGLSLSLGNLFDQQHTLGFAAGGFAVALLMYAGVLAFTDPPHEPMVVV